ncbi:MAG: threonylcarbamoyl-AMP synthase [Clostridiaceae bacterium]|nr:threonylcarbamoyl-AMP synthase [Clostridiaceae bacterium]
METKYKKVALSDLTELAQPAEAIKQGKLVAFPTETVYGLGANALDGDAVRSIFKAKGRPNDNPLIVHIADTSMLEPLVTEITPDTKKLIAAFWPGPLTLVLKKTLLVPDETTAGLDSVAVRMPDHPIALELIRKSGVPIAAPSANRSGRPSPTMAEHVAEDMHGRISWIVDGGSCKVGVESTVLDMSDGIPTILRPGGITPEMIEKVIGRVQLDRSLITGKSVEKPRSPGMKYTHYAPRGDVIVVSGEHIKVAQWINHSAEEDRKAGLKAVILSATEHLSHYPENTTLSYGSLSHPEEAATNIFRLFRQSDRNGAQKIYVEAIPKDGIGLAVMDRIEKAAAGRFIRLD